MAENDPDVMWFNDGKLTITGQNLAGVTQVKFVADNGGTEMVNDITENLVTMTDTEISTSDEGFENKSHKSDMTWSGKSAKLVVVKGEESVEYDVRFKTAE